MKKRFCKENLRGRSEKASDWQHFFKAANQMEVSKAIRKRLPETSERREPSEARRKGRRNPVKILISDKYDRYLSTEKVQGELARVIVDGDNESVLVFWCKSEDGSKMSIAKREEAFLLLSRKTG